MQHKSIQRRQKAWNDVVAPSVDQLLVVHLSKMLKIEYLCGRIDNMNENGDRLTLRRSFVYILSLYKLPHILHFNEAYLCLPLRVN